MAGKTAFELLREQASADNAELLTKSNNRLAAVTVPSAPSKPAARRAPAKKKEDVPPPTTRATRSSRRLAEANGEKKHKLERLDDNSVAQEPTPKRVRLEGDIELSTIAGKAGIDGLQSIFRGAQPGVRTFEPDEILVAIDDEGSKESVKRYQKYRLYEKFPGPGLKIFQTRIYSLCFHPAEDQPIILAGDKEGHLGLVKTVADETVEDQTWVFKPHDRTITSFAIPPGTNAIYSGSYDTSIRRFDTEKLRSLEVYAPGGDSDEGISCIDMVDENTIYFSTLHGRVGRLDLRSPGHKAHMWQLSDSKIGGFSVRPYSPHHLATASLDRTLKIWDIRKCKKDEDHGWRPLFVGEHASRLSVSHAAWSASGTHIATSSYDDTVKIYSFNDPAMWKIGNAFDEDTMKPSAVVRHNNQTGRWVTILKPHWQRAPKDKVDKLIIGNMNRFVDIYTANGDQLAQLGGDEITAVPAVAQFHPTMGWVAGGNASGKINLWTGPGEDSAWMRSG